MEPATLYMAMTKDQVAVNVEMPGLMHPCDHP